MKKYLIIGLILISSNIFCQVWIDQGAEWHYNYSSIGGGGFIKINYINDTIIDGHNCQKLVPERYLFTVDQYYNIIFLGTAYLQPRFTYSSGDTVFYYNNNQFYVLYNFGAQVGDSWSLGVDTNQMMCDSSYTYVDSIGTIDINSQTFRWISLSGVDNSSVVLRGKAIERFGSASGYLFPVEDNCDSNIVFDFDDISFGCFEDTSFSLYNVTLEDCEYLLSLSEITSQEIKSVFYPNPTKGIIRIENSELRIQDISVFDIYGREVSVNWSLSLSKCEIDLSPYPKGLYLIKLTTAKGVRVEKIVLE